MGGASFGDEIAIINMVLVGEEDRLAAIAALRDVMGDIRDHEAGEAGHARSDSRTCPQWQLSIVSPE
jgi:hypothetical protein